MKKSNKIVAFTLVAILSLGTLSITNTVNAKTIKKSGKYYTELKTKGEKVKYDTFARKIKFNKRKFTVTGKLIFGSKKVLKKAKRTFVISKKCKFYKGTYIVDKGKFNIKKTSKKKLFKKASKLTKGIVADCGQTLYWKVKNGKVIKLIYAQDEYTDPVDFNTKQYTDENGEPL